MPRKCCILNCRIQEDDPEGLCLSYYKLPSDESRKQMWIDSIKRRFSVEFKKHSYVCSLHFELDCFDNRKHLSRRILKKDSCPTLFPDSKKRNRRVTNFVQSSINLENKRLNSVDNVNNKHIEIITIDKPSNILNVSSSDNIVIQDIRSLENDLVHDHSLHNNEHNYSKKIGFENISKCTKSSQILQVNEHNSLTDLKTIYLPDHIQLSDDSNDLDFLSDEFISTDHSLKTNKHNESKTINLLQNSILFKKSLANIDIDSLTFTKNSLLQLKVLLKKSQAEVIDLRRRLRNKTVKMYRYKNRVNDLKLFISQIKLQENKSNKIYKILKVSD